MNDLNELAAVQRLGTVLDPPTTAPPDTLRRRVLAVSDQPRAILVRPRFGRRLVLGGALAGVLAAALVVPYTLRERAPEMAPAGQVLHDAAAHALSRPDLKPRSDQFVYRKTKGRDLNGKNKSVPFASEWWLSVDGSSPSTTRGEDGSSATVQSCARRSNDKCVPVRAYTPDLPTDAKKMLDYLYQRGLEDGWLFPIPPEGPDLQAFALAGRLLSTQYVPPTAQRAIFEALAQIPGVRVTGDVSDDAGRTGVAVAPPDTPSYRFELIFDHSTHEYLGNRLVILKDGNGHQAGDVPYSTAVLKIAIVDRAGQTP